MLSRTSTGSYLHDPVSLTNVKYIKMDDPTALPFLVLQKTRHLIENDRQTLKPCKICCESIGITSLSGHFSLKL